MFIVSLSSMYYLYKVLSDLPSVDTINILSSMYYLYKVLSDLPSVDTINILSSMYYMDDKMFIVSTEGGSENTLYR
jgi:hypothetical protein